MLQLLPNLSSFLSHFRIFLTFSNALSLLLPDHSTISDRMLPVLLFCLPQCLDLFLHIFNRSLACNIFPFFLKQYIANPIPKIRNSTSPPLSVLSPFLLFYPNF